MRRRAIILLGSLSFFVASRCISVGEIPELPEGASEKSLVRDLAMIVTSHEQTGWTIDELEVRQMLGNSIVSFCAVDATAVENVRVWFDRILKDVDIKKLYEQNGKSLQKIQRVLVLWRSRLLFEEAMKMRNAQKCPFWIDEQKPFPGVQDENHKLLLAFETGGRFYAQREKRDTIGAGGIVRMMVGYGFAHRFAVRTGLEFGFSAQAPDPNSGKASPLVFASAFPITIQHRFLAEYIEYEAGPLAYFDQSRNSLQWGVHLGIGVGVSRMRIRAIMPSVILTVNYQYVPPEGGFVEVHRLSIGARAAFSLGL
ncbi:MAG: hypothetical protein U1F27_11090 [Turneriella sp.]